MDICKNFTLLFRRKQLEEPFIFLSEDVTDKMKNYVRLMKNFKFEEGEYHSYYGDLKKLVASYVVWFSDAIDYVIKESDKWTNEAEKDDLLRLAQRTIEIHLANQVEFGKSFLPVNTPEEKQAYEEIEMEFDKFMKKLYGIRTRIEKFNKKEVVEEFKKEHFELSVRKSGELFNFGYTYLGSMCADSIDKIRISLVEILGRLSNNLMKVNKENEEEINDLLLQLYEKNKENVTVSRSARKNSVAVTEISRGMQNITSKIENFETEVPSNRLKEEVQYWTNRNNEFNVIADNYIKLKAEKNKVIESLKDYESLQCKELPGEKSKCWDVIGVNLSERKEELDRLIVGEMKGLMTFFACRGTDRIFYTDNVGPYYLDEFNHQNYVYDHRLGTYHINCNGEFVTVQDKVYYFDKIGRYVNEDGRKLYQCAPCTSLYELGDCDLLTKVTKDCGHSENLNYTCRMEIKDPSLVEILPDSTPINIKGTLPSETVKYLWDSFGSLLPDALYDVGKVRPRNPIHFLAHKLLYHKYRKTANELLAKKKEADEYRSNTLMERKEKAIAASKLWKSKQVKKRKPEESDNSEPQAAFDAHIAQQMFIHALNFYND